MFRFVAVMSCLCLLGCRGDWPFGKHAEPATEPVAVPLPATAEGVAAPVDAPLTPTSDGSKGAQYVITAQRLDRFIKYQEQTLKLYAEMMSALEGLEQPGDAGTRSGAAPIEIIRRHARAQEQVRRQVGLSAQDVHELERVVGDVISRRAMAEALVHEAPVQEIESLAARLPPEQRGELVRTLSNLKKREQETRTLEEERKKYGDANVDQVLTREEELTRQWNLSIATFAGMREAAQAPRVTGSAKAATSNPDAGTQERPSGAGGR